MQNRSLKDIARYALLTLLVLIIALLIFIPKNNHSNPKKETIVTSSYISYDLARSIVKGTYNTELSMLIAPGTDLHTYEPSPQDIIKIKESKVFIYNGGESEEWLKDIISEIDTNKTTLIRMMDAVKALKETNENILEEDQNRDNKDEQNKNEYDEHIWTSPKNAIKITQQIYGKLISIFPENKEIYTKNLEEQLAALSELDQDFTKLAAKKTGTIFVADRFPFRYLVNDYKFKYLAAFPGCSEQTEASAKTVSEMIKAINDSPSKVVFHIELSTQQTAKTIAEATGATMLELHSMHNISQTDFAANKTYLDFMRKNYDNLSKALHDSADRK